MTSIIDADDAGITEMRLGLMDHGFVEPRIIARGGTSIVWAAEEPTLSRTVAIKVGVTSQTAISAESRLLAKLTSHEGIVEVHRSGEVGGGRPFIVLEHCPGGSVAAYLRERGPLSPGLAIAICRGIAAALDTMHSLDEPVLHLDIKPSNLLVTRWGSVKLADFGIALTARDAIASAFSPAHAAPEQLTRQPVSPATDLYSLASVLHELIVGEPPFGRMSNDEIIAAKQSAGRPPLDSPRIGPELRRFLMTYLDHDPTLRLPGNARGFEKELEVLAASVRATGIAPRLAVIADPEQVDDITVDVIPPVLPAHIVIDDDEQTPAPSSESHNLTPAVADDEAIRTDRHERGEASANGVATSASPPGPRHLSGGGARIVRPTGLSDSPPTAESRRSRHRGSTDSTRLKPSANASDRRDALFRSIKFGGLAVAIVGAVIALASMRGPSTVSKVERALSAPLNDPLTVADGGSPLALTPIGGGEFAIEATQDLGDDWILQVTEWVLDPVSGVPVRTPTSTAAIADPERSSAATTKTVSEVRVFHGRSAAATLALDPTVMTCVMPQTLVDDPGASTSTTRGATCLPSGPPVSRTMTPKMSAQGGTKPGTAVEFDLASIDAVQRDVLVEWSDNRVVRTSAVTTDTVTVIGTESTCVSIVSGNAFQPLPTLRIGSTTSVQGVAQSERVCPWSEAADR